MKFDLRPPRSTMLWKLERLNAVAMSWPSRTQEEFIRPINFSISSSDLQHRGGREGFSRRRLFCSIKAQATAESVATCRWPGRSPPPGCQRSFHSGSSPPWVVQQQSEHRGHWNASGNIDNANVCHRISCGMRDQWWFSFGPTMHFNAQMIIWWLFSCNLTSKSKLF